MHTDTQPITSHSLTGWAWELEICGSQDASGTSVCLKAYLYLCMYVYGPICACVSIVQLFKYSCARLCVWERKFEKGCVFKESDRKQVNVCFDKNPQMDRYKGGGGGGVRRDCR